MKGEDKLADTSRHGNGAGRGRVLAYPPPAPKSVTDRKFTPKPAPDGDEFLSPPQPPPATVVKQQKNLIT